MKFLTAILIAMLSITVASPAGAVGYDDEDAARVRGVAAYLAIDESEMVSTAVTVHDFLLQISGKYGTPDCSLDTSGPFPAGSNTFYAPNALLGPLDPYWAAQRVSDHYCANTTWTFYSSMALLVFLSDMDANARGLSIPSIYAPASVEVEIPIAQFTPTTTTTVAPVTTTTIHPDDVPLVSPEGHQYFSRNEYRNVVIPENCAHHQFANACARHCAAYITSDWVPFDLNDFYTTSKCPSHFGLGCLDGNDPSPEAYIGCLFLADLINPDEYVDAFVQLGS